MLGLWTLDFRRWTLEDVERQTLDVRRLTLGRWEVGRWPLDVRTLTFAGDRYVNGTAHAPHNESTGSRQRVSQCVTVRHRVCVLISIDTLQSPSAAQRQHDRVGARTARPLRKWARTFRAHILAPLPVPSLSRPAALASRAQQSFAVRPTMPASPLPALQLACPPLRRRSPRAATSNTPQLPQRRALTWRPVHRGLLRASFNSAVHDATSTLAAVFGALASQPSAPWVVELLSEQWHQQCRVLRDAKQTQ